MAIERYTVNGDLTALKTALEATNIFEAVVFNDDEQPTAVLCKDTDDNIVFSVTQNSSQYTHAAYRSNGTSVSAGGSYSKPVYVYKIGTSSAAINCAEAKSAPTALVLIGKTNTGKIGVAMPRTFGATSANADITQMAVVAWDDDPAMTSLVKIGDMVGHSTLLVDLPLHGSYGTPENIVGCYIMPMTQEGMRGALQEITCDDKTYLTNGYVAILDDGGDET